MKRKKASGPHTPCYSVLSGALSYLSSVFHAPSKLMPTKTGGDRISPTATERVQLQQVGALRGAASGSDVFFWLNVFAFFGFALAVNWNDRRIKTEIVQ